MNDGAETTTDPLEDLTLHGRSEFMAGLADNLAGRPLPESGHVRRWGWREGEAQR